MILVIPLDLLFSKGIDIAVKTVFRVKGQKVQKWHLL